MYALLYVLLYVLRDKVEMVCHKIIIMPFLNLLIFVEKIRINRLKKKIQLIKKKRQEINA